MTAINDKRTSMHVIVSRELKDRVRQRADNRGITVVDWLLEAIKEKLGRES